MDYLKHIEEEKASGKLAPKIAAVLKNFFNSYTNAIESSGGTMESYIPLLSEFTRLAIEQIDHPYKFELFHQAIRSPIDYYQLGLEMIRPLILFPSSAVYRSHLIDNMEKQIAKGENVVLLANHQTEPDPQVISLLLEKTHPKFAENIIFVAGHRVITDPLAIPFSMGRHLLCIFSKKHIENPPEAKQEKLQHNQRTMKKMLQLLSEGGHCIYVAPSGGRDRKNPEGKVEVSPFDPQSIEMFWLMAQQAGRQTHFYSLALNTYHLLPPPHSIEKELGEQRHARCTDVHLAFGEEIDMEQFPGSENLDKRHKRKARADYIWRIVNQDYQAILNHTIS